MPSRIFMHVLELARERHRFVHTGDLRESGLDPKRLIDYSQRGLAEHVGHGLYRLELIPPGVWDEFMLATLWPDGRGVLSHETALDLHDLCDVNPNHIDVTVPKAYRTHRSVPALYRFHCRVLPTGDVSNLEGMRIVTPARAISDGIDAGLRPTLVEQAIDTAEREALITGEVAGRLRATLTAQ
jgi:predicted transcriptional regulator of viral defense system